MVNLNPTLNSVTSVRATLENGVYMLDCNITDAHGDTYDAEYCSRPDDPYGVNPQIRQWLVDHPGFPIQPYVPPTPEQMRGSMSPLSARQLRLGLVRHGFTGAMVDAAIAAMPEGLEKETAKIEWEFATTFNRMHPLIPAIGGALGLTAEAIDNMWNEALAL